MKTSVSAHRKTHPFASPATIAIALAMALSPVQANAGILIQTGDGAWVDGSRLVVVSPAMHGILAVPTVRGNSGYSSQRAMAWAAYRRADGSTGLPLVYSAGNGSLSASTPGQASIRSHVARATAYRLGHFKK